MREMRNCDVSRRISTMMQDAHKAHQKKLRKASMPQCADPGLLDIKAIHA